MPQHRFKKGEPRPAKAGRKKGTPNKFTTARAAFLQAFEELGGHEFIKRVAKTKSGQQCVLNNMAKLLPNKTELSGPDGGPIQAKIDVSINLVRPKGSN
jgi:hypothetical protein